MCGPSIPPRPPKRHLRRRGAASAQATIQSIMAADRAVGSTVGARWAPLPSAKLRVADGRRRCLPRRIGMDRHPTRSAFVLATVLAIVGTLAVGPAPQTTASPAAPGDFSGLIDIGGRSLDLECRGHGAVRTGALRDRGCAGVGWAGCRWMGQTAAVSSVTSFSDGERHSGAIACSLGHAAGPAVRRDHAETPPGTVGLPGLCGFGAFALPGWCEFRPVVFRYPPTASPPDAPLRNCGACR